jgi:hypothetical protein
MVIPAQDIEIVGTASPIMGSCGWLCFPLLRPWVDRRAQLDELTSVGIEKTELNERQK